jgi:orotate phosphoribosyltransferase
MRRYVEGPVQAGERVVILEDVVTTAGSSLLAIDRCVEMGLRIDRVLAIVDRLEGGADAISARGYRLQSLLTLDEILA